MALVETDWSISLNGDIRYEGSSHGTNGAGYITTIELHRYLQDKADNPSSILDNLMDITIDTPSDRLGIDNIIQLLGNYNIDNLTSQHIFDGSIIQGAGVTEEIYDGFVNHGNLGVNIQLLQNGAYIDDDFWNTLPDGETHIGLNKDESHGISHRFMVLVRSAGQDIDRRVLIGLTREYSKSYKEFKVNGTTRGNNPIALDNVLDVNNTTARNTIESLVDITNVEGFNSQDTDVNSVEENYYSKWTRGSNDINTFTEYIKSLCAYDSDKTLYGLDGKIFRGITHEIEVYNNTGSFGTTINGYGDPEALTWDTGTGQLLASNSATGATKIWIQLLTGTIPLIDTIITGTSSGATVSMSNIIERPISFTPFGLSTGIALNGSYGFGVLSTDLTSIDKLIDLSNNTIRPLDNRQTTITRLRSGGSRILVGPDNNGLMKDQFLLHTSVITNEPTVILTNGSETIGTGSQSATDTPSMGQFRLYDNSGVSHIVSYTGYTVQADSMTFTGCVGTPEATAGANSFIAYIDELAASTSASFTSVYHSPRTLYVRVRDGSTPTKTFQTNMLLGSSSVAISTPDI